LTPELQNPMLSVHFSSGVTPYQSQVAELLTHRPVT
jgi:hypothetical protein